MERLLNALHIPPLPTQGEVIGALDAKKWRIQSKIMALINENREKEADPTKRREIIDPKSPIERLTGMYSKRLQKILSALDGEWIESMVDPENPNEKAYRLRS